MRLVPTFKLCALAAVVTAVGVVACYNPDIVDGSLTCASAPAKQCPDGYQCRFTDNRCYKISEGAGGAMGTGGMGMGGGAGLGGGGAGGMCVMPIPGCAPSGSSGTCDQVCQTGCGCNQKCTLFEREVTCRPDNGGRLKVGEVCTGGPTMDRCAPGHICLDEPEPVCGKRCFRYCTDDSDCGGGAHCTVPLVVTDDAGKPEDTGVTVCDVPPDECSPIHGEGKCKRNDRPNDAYGCYLMGTGFPNATVCDCAGSLEEDAPCEVERECKPGLFCVANGQGKTACKRVCPMDQVVVAQRICGVGRSCVAFMGSSRWGTCQ